MASGPAPNEAASSSSVGPEPSENKEQNAERRKVVRIARDRMLEGYVPSAVFSANMKTPMSPIPEEHHQKGGQSSASSSLVLRLDDRAASSDPARAATSEAAIPPLTMLAQPKPRSLCEEFAMDVDDDDEDENEDEGGTVYDQVWCDSYGKWHRYDEWDYDGD